ncbi:MAG: DUF4160 domain-containing protein [Myxococcales bacterium]|nr:DUF4160 domain-containing protein [Myxococcales bacterium]
MPTVLRHGRLRFFLFSNERREPAHIHVEAGGGYAKFWLRPVSLAFSIGLSPGELRDLRRVVAEREAQFVEAWNGYFRV